MLRTSENFFARWMKFSTTCLSSRTATRRSWEAAEITNSFDMKTPWDAWPRASARGGSGIAAPVPEEPGHTHATPVEAARCSNAEGRFPAMPEWPTTKCVLWRSGLLLLRVTRCREGPGETADDAVLTLSILKFDPARLFILQPSARDWRLA